MKTFFKNLEYRFVVKSTTVKSVIDACKTPLKPMLRQIEWRFQNGTITKNAVLRVATFFLRILFQYKSLL